MTGDQHGESVNRGDQGCMNISNDLIQHRIMTSILLAPPLLQLGAEASRPVTPRPPGPEITTRANAEAAARDAEEKQRHSEELQGVAHQKWKYIQKHLDTISQV